MLVAPCCAACDRILEQPSLGCVCESCWSSIHPLTPPCCRTCGDALPSWRTSSFMSEQCPRCRRTPRALDLCRAVGAYEGSLRDIVHALKYGRRRSIARRLSGMMAISGNAVLDGAAFVIPVPLHRARRHARGFNQAVLLSRRLGVPVLDALVRVRDTVSQTELPASRRHANVRDAFALVRRRRGWLGRPAGTPGATGRIFLPRSDAHSIQKLIEGRCVVLVDDVSTTGATLEACARVLKQAGAGDVRALIAARAAARRDA